MDFGPVLLWVLTCYTHAYLLRLSLEETKVVDGIEKTEYALVVEIVGAIMSMRRSMSAEPIL